MGGFVGYYLLYLPPRVKGGAAQRGRPVVWDSNIYIEGNQ